MGRRLRSVSAWILVVRPPRERPVAWLRSPFSARGRAVRLHGGAIDKHLGRGGQRSPKHERDRPRRLWQPSGHNGCRAFCVARNPAAHRSTVRRLQRVRASRASGSCFHDAWMRQGGGLGLSSLPPPARETMRRR